MAIESERTREGLTELAAVAAELGRAALAREALDLATRLSEGRFFVACVGQFKRGKSSLVNALVGAPILPTGVAPVTSVVTVVRGGERLAVRVELPEGWTDVDPRLLAAYVTEQENPGNTKRVDTVEVSVPSRLLRDGLCLVDTPGIGSVVAHNTAATRAFVPHVDAAVVVLGVDPPISADELTLIEEIAAQTETLLFVLSKADRFSNAERHEAEVFTTRVLRERLGRDPGSILAVSATERLAGGTPRDWACLERTLARLARDSRQHLVATAGLRGIRGLADRLCREIDERLGALLRPLEDSERRVAALSECAARAEETLGDLRALMAAEHQRLARRLQAQQAAFLDRALPAAREALARFVRDGDGGREVLRTRALAEARRLHRELAERWRAEERPAAEELHRIGAQRFVQLADEFLERLVDAIRSDASGIPAMPVEVGFRVPSHLYYTNLLQVTGRSPLRWMLDQLRPAPYARRAIGREATRYLERLLTVNVSRVTNDLDEQARASGRDLEAEVRRHLRDIGEAARRSLADARAQHAQGEDAVRQEVERLRSLRARATIVAETNLSGPLPLEASSHG